MAPLLGAAGTLFTVAIVASLASAATGGSPDRGPAPAPHGTYQPQTPVWTRWEHALTSTREYANPYADVRLEVSYTGPQGEAIRSYGFWDGGATFRIRVAFPAPGRWRWRTTCSDLGNAGLHDQTGEVEVIAYRGGNALYQHGFLRVSADRRYLTYADGTPFFWLGDTAWVAPLRASQEDWQTYVDDRVAKGFNIIHLSPASAWGHGELNADVDGNVPFVDDDGLQLRRWNPAYWKGFDRKVQYANDRGVVIFLVGLMEPVRRYPEEKAARLFARNMVARLMGNGVVFSPSFDSGYERVALMRAVGEEIRHTTSMHLITNHFGTMPVEYNLHEASWLDFDMYQSGQNNKNGAERLRCDTERPREMARYLRELAPPKPCVNGEAVYELAPPSRELASALRARQMGYLSVLSGACGYTFGVQGVWDWGMDRGDPLLWSETMKRPSSDQMKRLGTLFRSVEWWRLQPAQELVLNQAQAAWEVMVLAKSAEGDLAMAYLPDNEAIDIDMRAFPTAMEARWFSPETGRFHAGERSVPNRGLHHFARPRAGDWVLLLERVSR